MEQILKLNMTRQGKAFFFFFSVMLDILEETINIIQLIKLLACCFVNLWFMVGFLYLFCIHYFYDVLTHLFLHLRAFT